MRQCLVQDGSRACVSQGSQSLDARERDPAVQVVRAQPALQGGDQRGHGLGGAQLGQEPYRVERVGDAQLVGGERGRRAGRTGVAEAGQSVGGGRAALRVTVVEQQDERLEGPPVAA